MLNLIRDAKAVWEHRGNAPHAIEQLSGLHTNWYFNSAQITSQPKLVARIVRDWFVPTIQGASNGVGGILSYAPFCKDICQTLAEAMEIPYALAGGQETIDVSMFPANREAILVCDDVHSGGSILRVYKSVMEQKISVRPVVYCIANCSGKRKIENLDIVSIITHDPKRWKERDCPLCRGGSDALPARDRWSDLIAECP